MKSIANRNFEETIGCKKKKINGFFMGIQILKNRWFWYFRYHLSHDWSFCWFVCYSKSRVEGIIESHSSRKALRNIRRNHRIYWIILSVQSWSWQCNLLLSLARIYFGNIFVLSFLELTFVFYLIWIEKSQWACWKWQNENESVDVASLSYVRRIWIGFVTCSLQASDPLFMVH